MTPPPAERRRNHSRTEIEQRHKPFGSVTDLVLVEGIEPTRPCGHRILSPARLPVPPHQHVETTAFAATSSDRPNPRLPVFWLLRFCPRPPPYALAIDARISASSRSR